MKEKRTRRYETVQCDDWVCRRWLTFGTAQSSEIPEDHWARMYGATCDFTPMNCFDCAWCGTSIVSNQPVQRYCTRACKRKASKAARRGAEFNAVGTYSWAQVVSLWVLFDKACAYCAAPTDLVDIQAEHVIALSRGGANNLSNLLPSCGPCNSDKRQLSLREWAADRRRRNLPEINTHWHASDPRYRHLSIDGSLSLAA